MPEDEWALLCVFQAMDAGRQGQHDQARDVRREPAGRAGDPSRRPDPRNWRTTSSGASTARCRNAAPSASSTAATTRRCWRFASIPEFLARQHLPKELHGKKLWDQRLEAIADFERYLTRQGIVVLKFFLNVSKEEQKRRFLDRLEQPNKHWKFSASDMAERAFWDDYQARLPGGDRRHRDAACALVRRAGGPQVVHAADRGRPR